MSGVDSFQAITSLKDNNESITPASRVQRSRLITTIAVGVLGLAWKLFLLPISVIGGGVGLVTGSIGLSFWVAGYVLSFWLSLMGLTRFSRNRKPSSTPPTTRADFSLRRQATVLEENPAAFVAESVDTNDEHTNNPPLMKEHDAPFGSALETDQTEGPPSPEEMVATVTELQSVLDEMATMVTELHSVLEENSPTVDQYHEDQSGIEKKSESEANLLEEPLLLEPEPEQGPDVIEVSVRLPTGERIERRFSSTETLQSVYVFVDSSGCLDIGSYRLATFFPRVVYGQQQLSSTLQELGLVQPQTSLFVELDW